MTNGHAMFDRCADGSPVHRRYWPGNLCTERRQWTNLWYDRDT